MSRSTQPSRGVHGSLFSAAIGGVLGALRLVPGVLALLAALTAMIILPLLQVFRHNPVALAICPALFAFGAWFCDSGRVAIPRLPRE